MADVVVALIALARRRLRCTFSLSIKKIAAKMRANHGIAVFPPRAEATECFSRRDSVSRRGLGIGPGNLAARSVARCSGMGDALVSRRGRNRVSLLDRVRLVL